MRGTPRALFDPSVLEDFRVLTRLMEAERRLPPPQSISFSDTEPKSRQVLAQWMYEVCEDNHCDEAVLPLAVTLLDRLAALTSLKRDELQLTGCVMLLLASKLRQAEPLKPSTLSVYSDHSVPASLIVEFELIILAALKWETSHTVATDYVEPLLARLSLGDYGPTIRRHTHTFIALATVNNKFLGAMPSLIASACVVAAANGLRRRERPWGDLQDLLIQVQSITGLDISKVYQTVKDIEDLAHATLFGNKSHLDM